MIRRVDECPSARMDKYFVQAGAADTGVRYYGFLTPTRKLESEKLFEDCLVLLLMNLASFPDEAGGFLQPNLPSSRSPTSSNGSILPYPRSTPLKPGSKKESSFIGYVDQTLLGISRRYELRTNQIFEDQLCSDIEVKGYKDFGEVAGDLDVLTDVVWVSGSRLLLIRWLYDPVLIIGFSFFANTVFPHNCP